MTDLAENLIQRKYTLDEMKMGGFAQDQLDAAMKRLIQKKGFELKILKNAGFKAGQLMTAFLELPNTNNGIYQLQQAGFTVNELAAAEFVNQGKTDKFEEAQLKAVGFSADEIALALSQLGR